MSMGGGEMAQQEGAQPVVDMLWKMRQDLLAQGAKPPVECYVGHDIFDKLRLELSDGHLYMIDLCRRDRIMLYGMVVWAPAGSVWPVGADATG